MSRPVILTEPAFEHFRRNAQWWATHHSVEQAERWYAGFLKELESLEDNPERCPLARENVNFPYELRELHYGVGPRSTHRALFIIRPDSVLILAIRHAAQDDVTPDDL